MRRYIKPVIIIALLVIFGGLGYTIVTKLKQKSEAEQKVQRLPQFTFHTPGNAAFSSAQLAKNKPVLIVHFDPDCEGCQYEAYEINKSLDLMKDIQVLMITSADADKAKQFLTDYQLEGYPFITLLMDKDNTFFRTFGAAATPMQVLYDKDHKLVKIFKGEVKMEAILKLLKVKH
jgi:peroxiredoxin